MRPRVRPGVDVLLDDPSCYLSSPRVGLITNPTGVTSDLTSTLEALHSHRNVKLVAIFGPEHGARGGRQDASPIESTVDDATGLPVYSLYGEIRKPAAEMLEEVKALVFDIQDVGARFYTYASTLTYCIEAASEQGVPLVVLDRPNPINGVSVEGNVLEPGFESFVGLHPIPIRHGLTIGELATLINEGIGAELSVVEMEGWERRMWFDGTGLPWVQPSPNIPTPETTAVYTGTCLFEGVNVSEGRGTTRPFEYLGAPWIDGRRWAGSLNKLGFEGVSFRACHFTPTFSKYQGEGCGGLQVHVTDRESYRPVETALHMLSTALELWPGDFEWLQPSHNEHLHFDLLAGTDKIRLDLSRGVPVDEIVEGWEEELDEFKAVREDHLLYPNGGA
ncbi:MAG: exo-beta-N-acetylmuramidase NamZ domain-containing protein [Candidatus Bathyarchaeia archaeon]